MRTSPLSGVIQHLLANLRPDGDGMTDGELLARFVRSRDEDALAALVRRHARMVWGVCRRLLNHHDAEDAFQATFLVLVRKAADVPREAIANWLYGVARQTAVRLRATAAKRGRRETQVGNMPEPTTPEVRDADLQRVVDGELSRLPDHYRGVVVLCDLEGMTRKEAARQLGIPEGSVASRLARARALLAKRLAQRGVVFSGSVAAVLSAGSASASVPPALVASTIKAASLLAAGQAAGVISGKVAALAEGLVQAMFVTKIKSVLAVALVVGLAFAGAGGLLYQTQAADQPQDAQKKAEKKPVPAQPTPQPAKTDRERMVGNWFIMNDDSQRKGEMWVITADSILMHAKHGGANAHHYAHRLDASKTPKQIDITVARVNGPTVGVINAIYVLDGDELRLCLGEMSKDRPAAFPENPKPGEVLILQRATSGATPPKAKGGPPVAKKDQEDEKGRPMTKGGGSIREEPAPKNAKQEQKVLTPEEAIKQRPKEAVTVQFKVAKVVAMPNPAGGFGGPVYYIFLSDGGKFTARLAKAADQLMKLGVEPVKHFTGKVVRVTGRVEPDAGKSSFQMWVRDLADIEVVKE
jgi:RNA polymerase sigma factor (sigma-70 family)